MSRPSNMVTRITCGIPCSILDQIDDEVKKLGYRDRSHLITEALREFLKVNTD